MQTLQEFVDVVWVTDDDLISRGRPDSVDGSQPRTRNPVWSKPDARNRSYELRRMTTESTGAWAGTDFYEFYWAHLMHGNTWDHAKSWILDLLCRRPSRVPKRLMAAWIALWILSAIVLAAALATAAIPTLMALQPIGWCGAGQFCWQNWLPAMATAIIALGGAIAGGFLTGSIGDVARYLKAQPPNVARRQEIREKGVELLESLMGVNADGSRGPTEYGRIVLVGHSLGTFIGYDILTHCFARLNARVDEAKLKARPSQPERAALELMIREAKVNGVLDVGAYQNQQQACLAEWNDQGNPWIVSDFITIGSPMAHAETLMAFDLDDLRRSQEHRLFPTCPPMPEHDLKTKLEHISYRSSKVSEFGDEDSPTSPRIPHHAALFGFTRWTNLYSPARHLLWGDLLAGPLGPQFGLATKTDLVSGIRDVPVLTEEKPGGLPPLFSHTKYWSPGPRFNAKGEPNATPKHIHTLRNVLGLK